MNTDSQDPLLPTPNFAPRLFGLGLLVFVIILAGFALIYRFAVNDYARDVQTWREKLNLIAESRSEDVDHWLDGHFKELRTLADNPSLQLYLTELQSMPLEGALSEDVAQKSYLRNLLVFTADRGGYSATPLNQAIPANIQPGNQGGLAIFNNKNAIVVSTAMIPSLRDKMAEQITHLKSQQDGFIDVFKGEGGKLYVGFIAPIYAVQGEHSAGSQMGKVVGITSMDSRFFGLLKHPGIANSSLETILVQRVGDKIDYLSPLQDGTEAMAKEEVADEASAEATLQKTPGDFISERKDYRDKYVLATSRAINNTPWTMIVKLDRKEALAESFQRRLGLIVVFVLIIAVMVLIIAAVWWQAYSKRSLLQSRYFQKLAAQTQAQEQLLRLVTDNQLEPIYIVDSAQIVRFGNQPAAKAVGMSPMSIQGKSLADIQGAARAKILGDLCQKALKAHEVVRDTHQVTEGGQEKIIHYDFIPLGKIPLASLAKPTPGVLVVEEDITLIEREREKRASTLRQVVETLIKLVDQRDPHAANHSLLVSELSYRVAGDMKLEPVMTETAGMAAKLMNIGKILVPIELLTKTKPLTEPEKQSILDSMNNATHLISHIDFNGPVAQTLQQWQERWDGKGPLGLSGEAILISARIIAAANAFVGMISPRSWRDAMSIETATQNLLKEAGAAYDRKVVITLTHFIENEEGVAWLKKILENKTKPGKR